MTVNLDELVDLLMYRPEESLRDHVIVRDRGSFLGTIVNGAQIGGRHHAGTAHLRIGENEITVGSAESLFRIRVTVERRTTGDSR